MILLGGSTNGARQLHKVTCSIMYTLTSDSVGSRSPATIKGSLAEQCDVGNVNLFLYNSYVTMNLKMCDMKINIEQMFYF